MFLPSSHIRTIVLFGLWVSLFASCAAQWQDRDRDSLIALLQPTERSITQLQRYAMIASSWMLSPKALPYLAHIDTLSAELLEDPDPGVRNHAVYARGMYHYQQGYQAKFRLDIPAALWHFEKAVQLEVGRSGPNSTAVFREAIGTLYRSVGETDLAITTLCAALPQAEASKVQDPMRSSSIHIELAGVYCDRGDWARASRELAQCDTSFNTIKVLWGTRRAFILEHQGQHRAALKDLDAALEAAARTPNSWDSIGVLASMARLKLRMADPTGALKAAATCADLGRRTGDEAAECSCLALAGEAYVLLGNDLKAEEILQQALEMARVNKFIGLARETGGEGAMVRTSALLRDLYLRSGQFPEAIEMTTYWSTLKDTLSRMDGRLELLRSNLRQKAMLDSLGLVRAAMDERRTALAQLTDEKEQRIVLSIGSATGALVLIVIALLLLKRLQQARRLTEQEKLLHIRTVDGLMHKQEINAINSMLEGQEKERDRMAKDLHDRLGSMLGSIKANMAGLEDRAEQMQHDEQCVKVNKLLDQAVGELRQISHNMAAATLSRFGLEKALKDLRETIHINGRLSVELVVFGLDHRLERSMELAVYRMVQELVGNVLKHAQAKELSIAVTHTLGRLSVVVSDDGKGFDTTLPAEGMGLGNVRSRASALSAIVQVDSTPGKGTTVIVEVPLVE